ncbi:Aldehyde/histidinol dehydrogenase [Fimicolochytrium jonesii]|uniref:Aldehyde/histidinol dehydrogenase n=1 Tax=Fimicolochytrium jonesii TaxID=1396493 RepID=UPI0022FEA320|nr:Aldehyde/histidinol dehydrogenase [Fimicolochytrium jonesii]KAI8816856.1 Aldehyde/histidinol dehydrogenase [Fimicolochytrium jonesii]
MIEVLSEARRRRAVSSQMPPEGARMLEGCELSEEKASALRRRCRNGCMWRGRRTRIADRPNLLVASGGSRAAKKEVDAGRLSPSLFARLDLSHGDKFASLLQGVLDVDSLPDPTNKITLARRLADDLNLYRVTCPVGVLLIIFEARPEVVVQISCLAIKSGNAVILKGGKEAAESNRVLFAVLREALEDVGREFAAENKVAGVTHDDDDDDDDEDVETATRANQPFPIPPTAIQLVSTRSQIATLLTLDTYIDLVIPRGSKSLVQYIQSSTRIPVLGHADGVCSVFIDASADVDKAVKVVVDAKTSYPAACNSAETLVVHRKALPTVLPKLAAALVNHGVQLRADQESHACLASLNIPSTPATPDDLTTEHLSLTLTLVTVASLAAAITHINTHGSHHTDVIVTEKKKRAERFMRDVDAAGVFWNASSRFADGFRYGFGAEIGVSTNKTHARGPVGLAGLLIYKYRLYGAAGHASAAYGVSGHQTPYLHQDIDGVHGVEDL